MQKPRLPAIEYIRGISMMGVIGIHVGAQYLENPSANMHLTALFEVVSRFSVPIFFFISAFGLFYHLDPQKPFHYLDFMHRRFRTVLIPYLVWSFFYLIHDGIFYEVGFPPLTSLPALLFFGNAKYQLYFLVILLWFYLLMPLWIWIVRKASWKELALLLVLQLAFNYFSSYHEGFHQYIYSLPQGTLLRALLEYRLNYWVFHYIFIFLLGGWLSVHSEQFQSIMQKFRAPIIASFWISLLALLGYYYELIFRKGYSQLEAIFTAHQLCPFGVFYTITASLFFFTIFTYQKYPQWLNPILSLLGRHSYFAYLAHPIAITYLGTLLAATGHIMTAPIAIVFYFAVLILAVLGAVLCHRLGNHIPFLNLLTIGVSNKK